MNRRLLIAALFIIIGLCAFLFISYLKDANEKVAIHSQIPSLNVDLTSKDKLLSYFNKLNLYKENGVTLFKINPVRSAQKITVKKVDIQVTDKVQQFEQYIDKDNLVYQSYDIKYLPETSTLQITIQVNPSLGTIDNVSQRLSYMIRVIAWDITQTTEFPGGQSYETLNKKNTFLKRYTKDVYVSSKKVNK